MFYKRFVKPILFRFHPEHTHQRALSLGRFMGGSALGRTGVALCFGTPKEDASVTIDGICYQSPVVLSAGFDPNGYLVQTLQSVAFGGIEVGSVTARPCKGNPAPNQIRLPKTKSLVVNKGLRNDGVVAVAERLRRSKRFSGFAVGVSIARTNDTESCDLDAGIDDYHTSMQYLVNHGIGDWLTINISCPNTYTGELFIEPENLEKLLTTLDTIPTKKPVYLKMPISVSEDRYLALCEVASRHRVNGLIIGNLQKDYSHIKEGDPQPETYTGGLSGVPCRDDANHLLSRTKEVYHDRFTLIGCGGVMSVEDAMEKFDQGAVLIHMLTGMIFEGPRLVRDIASAYAKRKR